MNNENNPNSSTQENIKYHKANQISLIVLSRLNTEFKKTKADRDMSYTVPWSNYICKLYDLKSSPEKLRNVYQSSESFEKFILDNCKLITNELSEYDDLQKQRQTPRRKLVSNKVKNAVVAIITTVGLVFALQGIAYSFGFDLFESIEKLGKLILNIPEDVVITQENKSIIKTTHYDIYETIQDCVNDLNIGLLYPTYLPDDNAIDKIFIFNSKVLERITIDYIPTIRTGMVIRCSLFDKNKNISGDIVIGGFDCQIVEIDAAESAMGINTIEAIIRHRDIIYYILYPDYNELVKII